jgi:hypothetical protein
VCAGVKFRITGEIAATPEQAIRTYHGSLERIAERLPNVARVEVVERTGNETRLRWYAKGDIPKAFHKVIAPEDLFWEDHAEWHFGDQQVYVEVQRPGMKKVRSDSRVVFEPTETGSRYKFEGDLKIEVPMFGGMLERFFVGFIESNTRRFFDLLAEEAAAQAAAEAKAAAPSGAGTPAANAEEPTPGDGSVKDPASKPKAKPKPKAKADAKEKADGKGKAAPKDAAAKKPRSRPARDAE